ncbi:glycoside hydrolase superfamily [Phialemonium atrogriseum]|uniref:Endoglucanase EG-II n=1 Tax=Phialemonium atrogriseum TaxID=1093897 RepID=A0AAJ0BWX2_9PEZI|nr:glycoside hydrolase superfamily [Phialemonium atrogriseum]KAK1764913.1 glycoside hydrolase superfamily [Phialemonium atrogriseum]
MHSTVVSTLALAAGAFAGVISPRAGVQYFGVNIAGFDFGCATTGACNLSQTLPPLADQGGPDGIGQMQHFSKDDGMNIFRLPVGWQYLVNSTLGGTLNTNNINTYDKLVQGCLATGAACIIDIHNYARWDGQIIDQGGPTNDQFASLWTQLATKYASEEKMIFGLMNEPHDVPDINKWADSVQAAVTAIREAGAKNQMILIPGNDWTSAQQMPTKSGPALLKVKNPDGSTDGIVFDVHKYLDSDNSGTHTECVTDNIDTAFSPLADWLRTNKRQALNSETGGGNTDSCEKYLCQQIDFLNKNSDVFLGYTGWSAGAFSPRTYELSEVPTKNGDTWTDSALVKACFKNSS